MVPAAEVNSHERAAGLREPPGAARALPPRAPAVLVAEFRVFLGNVERPPGRVAADELVGLLGELVDRLHVRPLVEMFPHRVEPGGWRAAVVALWERRVGGQ